MEMDAAELSSVLHSLVASHWLTAKRETTPHGLTTLEYAFTHPLVRNALYELTPASVRNAVHYTIASYIETTYAGDPRFFAVLGQHFSRSGMAPKKSMEYLCRAADHVVTQDGPLEEAMLLVAKAKGYARHAADAAALLGVVQKCQRRAQERLGPQRDDATAAGASWNPFAGLTSRRSSAAAPQRLSLSVSGKGSDRRESQVAQDQRHAELSALAGKLALLEESLEEQRYAFHCGVEVKTGSRKTSVDHSSAGVRRGSRSAEAGAVARGGRRGSQDDAAVPGRGGAPLPVSIAPLPLAKAVENSPEASLGRYQADKAVADDWQQPLIAQRIAFLRSRSEASQQHPQQPQPAAADAEAAGATQVPFLAQVQPSARRSVTGTLSGWMSSRGLATARGPGIGSVFPPTSRAAAIGGGESGSASPAPASVPTPTPSPSPGPAPAPANTRVPSVQHLAQYVTKEVAGPSPSPSLPRLSAPSTPTSSPAPHALPDAKVVSRGGGKSPSSSLPSLLIAPVPRHALSPHIIRGISDEEAHSSGHSRASIGPDVSSRSVPSQSPSQRSTSAPLPATPSLSPSPGRLAPANPSPTDAHDHAEEAAAPKGPSTTCVVS